jgi:hypothetical protein
MTQHNKPQPITVFYSYVQEDSTWREKLANHLAQLKHDGTIQESHEQMILAGSDRTQALNEAIATAQIILLLISADFLASDICYQQEMQQALARHQRKEAHIIPILVRACDWQRSPIGDLQCLPRDHEPLNTAKDPDAAMLHIVEELRLIIDTLKKPLLTPNHTSSTTYPTSAIPSSPDATTFSPACTPRSSRKLPLRSPSPRPSADSAASAKPRPPSNTPTATIRTMITSSGCAPSRKTPSPSTSSPPPNAWACLSKKIRP